MRASLIRFIFVAAALLAASPVWACNVPVFRYALEQWAPDQYFFGLMHNGPLSENDQKQFELLTKASESKSANLDLDRVDLSSWPKADRAALLLRKGHPSLPRLTVKFPLYSRIQAPI